MMRIRGVRTSLRPVAPADLDLLAGWLADPGVYAFWGGAPLDRETVAVKYIGARAPQVVSFVVEAADQPIGYIHYWYADGRLDADNGGLDMFLIPSARG